MPTIRNYRPDDNERLWSLLELGLAPYGLVPDACTTDDDLKDVGSHYLERGGRFRVLVDGDRIIGMYGLHNEGDGVVELRKMYLDTACKGRGYGKQLLNDALATARQAGFRRMILETNRLLVEAIGLYEKYGFVESAPDNLSARCDKAMTKDL